MSKHKQYSLEVFLSEAHCSRLQMILKAKGLPVVLHRPLLPAGGGQVFLQTVCSPTVFAKAISTSLTVSEQASLILAQN